MRRTCLLLSLLIMSSPLQAVDAGDSSVDDLTLIGVIFVEGAKSAEDSLAVLRDKKSGKTLMLRQGDKLADSNVELRRLGPGAVTLVRAKTEYVLRVEATVDLPKVVFDEEDEELDLASRVLEAPILGKKVSTQLIEIPAAERAVDSKASDTKANLDSKTKQPAQRYEPAVIYGDE